MNIPKILIIAMLLTSAMVSAGQVSIHTATWHYETENVESFTPGIAYTTSGNWRFGALQNSYGVTSVYAAKVYPITPRFRFGLGAITGYVITDSGRITGRETGMVPILSAEVDLTDHVSVAWFATALNLMIRF